MKTPQIMIDRLSAITDTEEHARHIATLIELANENKIKEDFDVATHIAKVLTTHTDDMAREISNFDYKAIRKPITKQLSQETRQKRYEAQLAKLQAKYNIKVGE